MEGQPAEREHGDELGEDWLLLLGRIKHSPSGARVGILTFGPRAEPLILAPLGSAPGRSDRGFQGDVAVLVDHLLVRDGDDTLVALRARLPTDEVLLRHLLSVGPGRLSVS
jgi:hypothetical protein